MFLFSTLPARHVVRQVDVGPGQLVDVVFRTRQRLDGQSSIRLTHMFGMPRWGLGAGNALHAHVSSSLPKPVQGSTGLLRQARPLGSHRVSMPQQLQITQVTSEEGGVFYGYG